jgi:transcriptional regulator
MEKGTIRQQIFLLLQQEEAGARDISQVLGLPEKEVFSHLEHIAKTALRLGYHLKTAKEASCLACGYVFRDRRRFTTPGRCPNCRFTHISEPLYRLKPV